MYRRVNPAYPLTVSGYVGLTNQSLASIYWFTYIYIIMLGDLPGFQAIYRVFKRFTGFSIKLRLMMMMIKLSQQFEF